MNIAVRWNKVSLLKCLNFRQVSLCCNRFMYSSPKRSLNLGGRSLNVTSNRNIYRMFFKRPSENTFKIMDNVPEEYNLIYRTDIDKYLVGCQIFITFAGAIVAFVVLLSSDQMEPTSVSDNSILATKPLSDERFTLVAFFCLFIVSLQILISRTPVRIYNYPRGENYIFVFRGSLPFSKKFQTCQISEVVKMEETGILPWRESRYKIVKEDHEARILLLEHLFRKPADLHIMLGSQKDHSIHENKN